MYVLDFGVAEEDEEDAYRKGSGVIWRIVKNK
jgi:hypothetical protein